MWIIWLEKKILQTLGIIAGVLLVLLTAFHFYLVNNAEKLLEDLVESRSEKKLKLHVRNLKFNYFSNKIELENVLFYSVDSAGQKTAYRFTVNHIKLRVKKVIPIFTRKELLIDSLYLTMPNVEVTRLRTSDAADPGHKKEVSIPEEMGRIYNSIMDALRLLQVNRFEFINGKFTLSDKTTPGQLPLTITNLHFYIDNLRLDSSGQKKNIVYSDEMVFQTRNQDILFPDGKHWLGFSRFRIDIRKRSIEIDSCTVSGIKSDSSKARFSVFLDTLKLANFDFTALYLKELIKADSVYCLNPEIKLVLESRSKTGPRAPIPDLDTLIQQLTGNLQLGYIGFINAGVSITTYLDDQPSSFTSDKNNFEMMGLTIDREAARPVTLEGFSMAIRHYENFIRDSSYFLRFDSILLKNDKLQLSNFSINTEPGVDAKNIQVRRFQLTSLSWPDLLFNRLVKAREATLFDPVINYRQPQIPHQRKKQNIFEALGGISRVMELDRLRIENGQINLQLNNETEIKLLNARLVINSNQLVESKELGSIENSVQELQFEKSVLKLKNIFAEWSGAYYQAGGKQLSVRDARMYNREQTINARLKNMLFQNINFDAPANSLFAGGLSWQQANVEINLLTENPKPPAGGKEPLLLNLENIRGQNTRVEINNGSQQFYFFLNRIDAAHILKKEKPEIEGLILNGKDFSATNNNSVLAWKDFNISDKQVSQISNLGYRQVNAGDSVLADIPSLVFTPDVNRILEGNMKIGQVVIDAPRIQISKKGKDRNGKNKKAWPALLIDQAEIRQPDIRINGEGKKGGFAVRWTGARDTMTLENIRTEKNNDSSIQIEKLSGRFSNIEYLGGSGKPIRTGEAEFFTRLETIRITPGEGLQWEAKIKEMEARNLAADSIGKNHSRLEIPRGELRDFFIRSEQLKNLQEMVAANTAFSIHHLSGKITDKKNQLQWHNLSFERPGQTVRLDSFSFNPVVSRDVFVAASPYQTDYMTLKSGAVQIRNLDLDLFLKDSILKAATIHITQPHFTSYRDKRPPFLHGIIKPLPPGLIKKLPIKISVDTIQFTDGKANYTELNEKTNETGNIPVTRISGDIFPVRNYNLTPKDTLRIRVNGYLMDSAWLRVRIRESYTDSLEGFLLTLRMRPGSLTYLNPALIPLASVRLQSGYLDTLQMRAVGHDQLSLGEMRMFYRDLKVQFLKDGSETKKTFLTGLINFIANSFVIKNNNRKKTGVVYFPRIRDRSFVNYYIKMTMSGIASSVGAKSTRKMMRKYRKEIKQRQLPAIEYD